MIYWINDNLLPEENAVLHLMIYSADDVMVKEIHDVPVFLKQGSHVIFSEKNTFLFNGNSPENHYMKVELRDTMGKIKYERTMKCTPRSSQFLVPKKTSEGWSVGKFRVD